MQIRNNFEIKNLTTYKIGGKVKTLYLPETLEELTSILRELDEYVVLGSCSDVLFSSNGYSGNVIITTEMKKFEIRGTKIYAECGVKDPMLAKSVSEVSLSGLEFLIGLPGTIGGAVYMNAGTHGQCIADTLVSCCLFDCETKEVVYKKKEDMQFSYRHSLLHDKRFILLYAEFELKRAPLEDIKALMERNLTFRKTVQPSLANPNAGSVFKNPENDSAGRLLDKAGVKEFEAPNVKIWEKHANFIVNKGDATSEDVLEMMVKMHNAVKDTYTIELRPEIIFIGDKTEKEEELCNILYQKKQK